MRCAGAAGRKADHAAQEIRVGGLLQKILKGHSFVGHRRFLGCVEFAIRPYRRFGDDRPQAARSLRRYGERAPRPAHGGITTRARPCWVPKEKSRPPQGTALPLSWPARVRRGSRLRAFSERYASKSFAGAKTQALSIIRG